MELNIEKYINIHLQSKNELESALAFNRENEFEYYIRVPNNLVDLELITLLLKSGYELITRNLESEQYIYRFKGGK